MFVVNLKILSCFHAYTGYEFLLVFISLVLFFSLLMIATVTPSLIFYSTVYHNFHSVNFYTSICVVVISIFLTDIGSKYFVKYYRLGHHKSTTNLKESELENATIGDEDETKKILLNQNVSGEEEGKMQYNYRKIVIYI